VSLSVPSGLIGAAARVIKNAGGLKSDEAAVGAGEGDHLERLGTPPLVAGAWEKDTFVRSIPVLLTTERAFAARITTREELEDALANISHRTRGTGAG
jgi:hypothetical protein